MCVESVFLLSEKKTDKVIFLFFFIFCPFKNCIFFKHCHKVEQTWNMI